MSITQGVYLGTHGGIEIKRDNTEGTVFSEIAPEDVNLSAKRFSFSGSEMIITGDKVRFTKMKGTTEEGDGVDKGDRMILVKGASDEPSIERYAHKDMLGGIRLFDSYKDAINGDIDNALELSNQTLNKTQKMRVRVEPDSRWNGVAKVGDWSFTTNRQAIDLTTLGDEFVKSYEAGLIQGQGTLTALWDDKQLFCDSKKGTPLANDGLGFPSDGKPRMPVKTTDEVANYFVQLCIRVSIGAKFKARLYIKYGGDREIRDPNELAVFWEGECICTNISMSFQADNIVVSRIAFITESTFRLRMADPYELDSIGFGSAATRETGFGALTTEDGREIVGRS